MKKSRITALILAAAIAVIPAVGCRSSHRNSIDNNPNTSGAPSYAGMSDVGVNKSEISIGEETTVNFTTYKLNGVIDSGYVKDGLKYIYLDVSIKNISDENYKANALNNFYLTLSDNTEVTPNVRADSYASKSVEGYEHLSEIPAGEEFNGYIGFCVDQSVDQFKVGFFASGNDIDDKSDVIFCNVASGDIKAAPEGFIKD